MLKKVYGVFCKVEEVTAGVLLAAISGLVFAAAAARTAGAPINWAMDVSLLLFAWEVFLGGDIAIRSRKLVNVDMFVLRFPQKIQKALSLIFAFIILIFLLILVRYGIPLCIESIKRTFQTLPISYAWCTLAVPFSAIFMLISQTIIIVEDIKKPAGQWGRQITNSN
ncbi:MAG: TRAP transporter small permease subunit [Elusimicrobiota bacterium]|jgi:TRAP-type C4-dicarboxylate transport system permease small subunit|nr:TRAP transporter small permease subunit [Elusimicrobiota bacterium]